MWPFWSASRSTSQSVTVKSESSEIVPPASSDEYRLSRPPDQPDVPDDAPLVLTKAPTRSHPPLHSRSLLHPLPPLLEVISEDDPPPPSPTAAVPIVVRKETTRHRSPLRSFIVGERRTASPPVAAPSTTSPKPVLSSATKPRSLSPKPRSPSPKVESPSPIARSPSPKVPSTKAPGSKARSQSPKVQSPGLKASPEPRVSDSKTVTVSPRLILSRSQTSERPLAPVIVTEETKPEERPIASRPEAFSPKIPSPKSLSPKIHSPKTLSPKIPSFKTSSSPKTLSPKRAPFQITKSAPASSVKTEEAKTIVSPSADALPKALQPVAAIWKLKPLPTSEPLKETATQTTIDKAASEQDIPPPPVITTPDLGTKGISPAVSRSSDLPLAAASTSTPKAILPSELDRSKQQLLTLSKTGFKAQPKPKKTESCPEVKDPQPIPKAATSEPADTSRAAPNAVLPKYSTASFHSAASGKGLLGKTRSPAHSLLDDSSDSSSVSSDIFDESSTIGSSDSSSSFVTAYATDSAPSSMHVSTRRPIKSIVRSGRKPKNQVNFDLDKIRAFEYENGNLEFCDPSSDSDEYLIDEEGLGDAVTERLRTLVKVLDRRGPVTPLLSRADLLKLASGDCPATKVNIVQFPRALDSLSAVTSSASFPAALLNVPELGCDSYSEEDGSPDSLSSRASEALKIIASGVSMPSFTKPPRKPRILRPKRVQLLPFKPPSAPATFYTNVPTHLLNNFPRSDSGFHSADPASIHGESVSGKVDQVVVQIPRTQGLFCVASLGANDKVTLVDHVDPKHTPPPIQRLTRMELLKPIKLVILDVMDYCKVLPIEWPQPQKVEMIPVDQFPSDSLRSVSAESLRENKSSGSDVFKSSEGSEKSPRVVSSSSSTPDLRRLGPIKGSSYAAPELNRSSFDTLVCHSQTICEFLGERRRLKPIQSFYAAAELNQLHYLDPPSK